MVAVDVPGFGESAAAGAGFELDAVADRIVAALGLDAFDLVGHSLGGAIAVAIAARHPEAVRRLVLVSPAGLAPRAVGVAAALGRAADVATRARRALGHRVRRPGPRAGPCSARPWPIPAGSTPTTRACCWRPPTARSASRRASAGARRRPARRPRDARACRSGLIWGAADRVVPYAGLAALRLLRPDAPVETLPATGHIPQVEDPAAFAAALERILAALD